MKYSQFLVLLTLVIGISGCGQQGPLYLPGTKPPIVVAKPVPEEVVPPKPTAGKPASQ